MSAAEARPDDDATTDAPDTGHRFGVADLLIAVVVGFFFAVSLYIAAGNLVALPAYLDAIGLTGTAPWATLIAAIAVPVLLFGGALALGRGRPVFARALILLVALAANSALAASLSALGLALIQVG